MQNISAQFRHHSHVFDLLGGSDESLGAAASCCVVAAAATGAEPCGAASPAAGVAGAGGNANASEAGTEGMMARVTPDPAPLFAKG
jgi:hypothetical protein